MLKMLGKRDPSKKGSKISRLTRAIQAEKSGRSIIADVDDFIGPAVDTRKNAAILEPVQLYKQNYNPVDLFDIFFYCVWTSHTKQGNQFQNSLFNSRLYEQVVNTYGMYHDHHVQDADRTNVFDGSKQAVDAEKKKMRVFVQHLCEEWAES